MIYLASALYALTIILAYGFMFGTGTSIGEDILGDEDLSQRRIISALLSIFGPVSLLCCWIAYRIMYPSYGIRFRWQL